MHKIKQHLYKKMICLKDERILYIKKQIMTKPLWHIYIYYI